MHCSRDDFLDTELGSCGNRHCFCDALELTIGSYSRALTDISIRGAVEQSDLVVDTDAFDYCSDD
jgi:hypothetical protein